MATLYRACPRHHIPVIQGQPCPLCPPPRTGSSRAWRTVREQVLERDGYRCLALEHGVQCTARATEVHHITGRAAGGTDQAHNLASVCNDHHQALSRQHN